ncbi:putative RNA pseudouridylate synthase [Lyophyllum shimeji]|uniref:RNA pseudouridylate synthase n=1 Tax=Lyophyllum shimeji TaxID=47721 RepID=A0A9P3UP45_LYOSH|nr:putative RNA pseudouridylate synthase [Lyophyllum shimeji]
MTDAVPYAPKAAPGLKKIPPYWYPYTTMAKERWLGRELLEVVSTEFRDRSMEYYRYALESGVTTINGKIAGPDTIIQNGDRIENVVHRHEPPVTSTPVRVLLHDVERQFVVVDKPGSIPVHASGRYFRNTLVGILENDMGYGKVYTVNRLDRLTSGLMILPLTAEKARELTSEFMAGTVRKEYVARCKGKFPTEEVTCEEPLLTVDRQMGLNIVHPEGKPAKTIFNRIRYDANTDTSVVLCRPMTGRSHQIRVHLQFLGHPIANDPVYSETRIWGENLGKGGIDIVPSEERSAPAPPPHLQSHTDIVGNPESLTKETGEQLASASQPKLLPRETGKDIGMGSPVPLSSEAVDIITRLRNMKDEDEDWSRWRDVVFRAKGKLTPRGLEVKPPPPSNQRKRGGHAKFVDEALNRAMASTTIGSDVPESSTASTSTSSPSTVASPAAPLSDASTAEPELVSTPPPPQLSDEEALQKVSEIEPMAEPTAVVQSENLYCPECYLPLHPDPKPERLYIFLHALRYTTSLGSFKTEMPEWAAEGWTWDRS